MAYIGRPLQVANLAVQSGTGDGADTTPIATLDYATVTNGIAVYLDGVRQLAGTDFNVTAQTTLTFTTAPANGVGVDVYFLGLELSLPTPADGTVATAKIADDAVTLAKMAPGTDGNIISYDASGNPVAIATGSSGQVLTSGGAGAAPSFAAAGGGKVLQVVHYNNTARQSGSTTMPNDDTIPQITEGDQIMTLAITPTSGSTKLLIQVQFVLYSSSGAQGSTAGLFNTDYHSSNAMAGAAWSHSNAGHLKPIMFSHYMTTPSSSETTFTVRVGLVTNVWVIGGASARLLGGTFANTMTITELSP